MSGFSEYEYDALHFKINSISSCFSIRPYSDGTYCISARIDDKLISIEGCYELVSCAISALYKNFSDVGHLYD